MSMLKRALVPAASFIAAFALVCVAGLTLDASSRVVGTVSIGLSPVSETMNPPFTYVTLGYKQVVLNDANSNINVINWNDNAIGDGCDPLIAMDWLINQGQPNWCSDDFNGDWTGTEDQFGNWIFGPPYDHNGTGNIDQPGDYRMQCTNLRNNTRTLDYQPVHSISTTSGGLVTVQQSMSTSLGATGFSATVLHTNTILTTLGGAQKVVSRVNRIYVPTGTAGVSIPPATLTTSNTVTAAASGTVEVRGRLIVTNGVNGLATGTAGRLIAQIN